MKRILLLLIAITVSLQLISARNKLLAKIPFELTGSFIVVEVSINNSTPLRMILDSGLRNTLITEIFPSDSINLIPGEIRELQGLGSGITYKAYESTGNHIKIGKINCTNRNVFAFQEKFFNLSKQTGTKINGLLGVDFFREHIVQIDYVNRLLRIYSNENFEAPKGYSYMPLYVQRQKIYIQLSVLETDSARQRIKMLIDTGAELTAWFETLRNKAVDIPDKSVRGRIGEGLSGEINGLFARVGQLCLADFCVKNPVVAFPDSTSIGALSQNDDRDGTIGGQLLRRFHLIFDAQGKKLYFKPNAYFNHPFKYNVAGIEIAQADNMLPVAEVTVVWKDSPAERAGLQVGDILTEINYEKLFQKSISDIRHYFETPASRPLKLTVNRQGKELELTLDMKERI